MTREFHIQHKTSTPYHPQANGAVKEFNKILENTLTKVYNTGHDDWDLKIRVILWTYRRTFKILTGEVRHHSNWLMKKKW